jgi:DNA-binding transcriptional ArsR family regulator
MSRTTRTLLVAFPVLALSLGALLRARQEAPVAQGTLVSVAQAPRSGPAALRRQFVEGQEHLYALHMTQSTLSARMDPAAQSGQGAGQGAGQRQAGGQGGGLVFQVELKGNLSLTPVGSDGGVHIVRVSLGAPSFHLRQEGADALPEEARRDVERSLAEASFVELSPAGKVLGYRFPATVAPLARSLLRASLASTQPTLASDGAITWQTIEGDSGGEFEAVYLRSGAAGLTLTRRKGQYLRITSPKGLVSAKMIDTMSVGGSTSFLLDPAGWVKTAEGVETVSSSAESAHQVGSTRVELSLALLKIAEQPSFAADFEQARGSLARTIAAENDLAASAAREVDLKLAGKAQPAAVLRRLEALTDADGVARADTKDQLSAMVRLDAKAASVLSKAVRGGLPAMAAGTVVGALASAGTEDAARALAEISADRSLSGGLRADATMALATSEDVSKESISALRKAADSDEQEVKSAGALGMGAAARGLAERGQEGADELVTSLLERLDQATTDEERATLFNALGNSGDARLVPRVRASLAGDGPVVRAAAITALRLVGDQTADDIIAATLVGDAERTVRSAALLATSFRSPALHVSSLEAHVQHEPLKSLRLGSVSLLGRWRGVAGAAAVLYSVMKSDKEPEVRAAAEALLNG